MELSPQAQSVQSGALKAKLERIIQLETQHGVMGVSFAVEDGATVLTEESVDFVIAAIEAGAKHLKELDSIPTSQIGL